MNKLFVVTLFPEYFEPLKLAGVVGQALRGERAQLDLELVAIDLRDFSTNNYKGVDDTPYGGGPGMVMKADVLANAVNIGILETFKLERSDLHIVYTAPRGKVWSDVDAQANAKFYTPGTKSLVYICGRYEGVDERFLTNYVDEFFSLGDFVLSGGEIAVMAMIDSALRFVPGVLGNNSSAMEDSFTSGLLEYPQYTKPRDFEGQSVPEVLLNGHHAKIVKFQKEASIKMTKKHRPDLLVELENKRDNDGN
jgi:tRNA (guanine37-N1)-methyltransferase